MTDWAVWYSLLRVPSLTPFNHSPVSFSFSTFLVSEMELDVELQPLLKEISRLERDIQEGISTIRTSTSISAIQLQEQSQKIGKQIDALVSSIKVRLDVAFSLIFVNCASRITFTLQRFNFYFKIANLEIFYCLGGER
jgi:hypothetical protein